MKLKVYGADICIDCRNFKVIMENRGFEVDYIDIVENTSVLKEFLFIRDTDPLFAEVRERHGIGIPLFVKDDGAMTFDMDEALSWIGQPPLEADEIVETGMSCGVNGCKW